MNRRMIGLVVMLTAGLCTEFVCGADIVSASSGFWTNAATWSPAQVPTNTDAVTITNGCTVTTSDIATHYVASLTIQTNGALTHASNTTVEACKVILSIASNLTVNAGGAINVDGMGYTAGQGPGHPTVNHWGGCYGGIAGGSGTGMGPTYGSITSPTNCGSGGYNGPGGGGAIRLIVGGTTTVNGAISATGGSNGTWNVGSGGAVFLTTGVLMGSGTIRANGGYGFASGGGGRIAVILTNATGFSNVKLQAYGSICPNSGSQGAGGTIYLENTNNTPGHGTLVVDYGNVVPANRAVNVTMQNGKDASSYSFSTIILTNGAVYALGTNNMLDITSTAIPWDPTDSNRYNGIYLAGGTLTVPAAFSFSNYFIAIGATNATFNPTTSLTVGTNGTFKDDVPYTLNCPVTVQPGGCLSHSANSSTEAYKMNLTILGSLNIQTGGQANVDSLGYAAAAGPGQPTNSGVAVAGSYGGIGGGSAAGVGPTYGSITAPTNCGSGGHSGPGGGGAIQLNVSGTTTVNGLISAGVSSNATAYSGSGGSVLLTTGTLTGNGTICANGGVSYVSGGGGRVAVILTNATDFANVKIQAYSSACGNHTPGAAGTVYLQTQAQGPGQGSLFIDASNIVPADVATTTLISSQVTDRVVGTVVITNSARLQIYTNQSLTVNGSWSNRATFLAGSNSTVILASTNAATVAGSNTFYNLICTAAVKTVSFEAGKTNTIQGKITLAGVTLNSTVGGQYSYLTLLPAGTQQVNSVTVRDSNAGGGQPMIAGKGSVNGGHNINWIFSSGGSVIIVR